MSTDDLKYAWAAYRKGGFKDIPEGLAPVEFNERLLSGVEKVSEVYTLTMPKDGSRLPLGLVFVNMINDPTPHILPSVVWFPWATTRNKLETFTKWLAETRLQAMVMITAPRSEHSFHLALCRRGILRTIGSIHGFFEDENAMLYQSVRKA
jgi:hypothetical protein